ncbi:hypothetical protein ACPEH7_02980 [Stenotrophomonas sp. NPDC101269]|uniref:hypothetical protein n=1 Tax=Stenotrophomonas sp. NPDC101269 TaxID=3415003 RepID=UPI003C2D79F6
MHMGELKDWVREAVQISDQESDFNALAAAFRLAIMSLLSSRMSAEVLEETMTGTVLGALATSVKICGDAYEGDSRPGCSWVKYSKAGKTWSSESKSGADFAIFIDMGGCDFRLAVFQAKRKTTASSKINVEQKRDGSITDSGIPQFLRLVEYARAIHEANGGAGFCLDNAKWVHYLVYEQSALYCCSLDQLESLEGGYLSRAALADIDDASRQLAPSHAASCEESAEFAIGGSREDSSPAVSTHEGSSPAASSLGTIDLEQVELRSFLEVLDSGANGCGEEAGWLKIETAESMELILGQLVMLMPVCFAKDESSPAPEPEMRKSLDINPPLDFKKISSSVFSVDGRFIRPKFDAKKVVASQSSRREVESGLADRIAERRVKEDKGPSLGLSGKGSSKSDRKNKI